MVRESHIEGKVKLWAKAHGILVLKVNPAGTAGYPDDLFLFNGRVCFVEFKAPGKKPRPLQAARIADLQRRGYAVAVINDIHKGITFLESAALSAGSCEAWDHASMRWIPTEAGHGQDDNSLRHTPDSQE
jgi:hypothetical protein